MYYGSAQAQAIRKILSLRNNRASAAPLDKCYDLLSMTKTTDTTYQTRNPYDQRNKVENREAIKVKT